MRGRTPVRLTAAAAAQQTQTVSRLWWCLRCLLRSTGSQSSLPQVSRPRRTSCIRSGVHVHQCLSSLPAPGSRAMKRAPRLQVQLRACSAHMFPSPGCRMSMLSACSSACRVFFVLVRAFSLSVQPPSRQIVQHRGCTAKCRGATHHSLSHRRRRGQLLCQVT